MRIAVCDDSRLSMILFIDTLREWNPAERAECFSSGTELLKALKEEPAFDIVFLDIYLPDESGIDLASEIRKLSPHTAIVFLTNSQDHAVDAYSLNALHYLVKPVTVEGLGDCFRRLDTLLTRPRPIIVLNIGKSTHTVYLDEIVYILSERHVKVFYLSDGRILRVRTQLQDLEEKLNKTFLKLNRGTIANMEHIRQMSGEYCLLDNGMRLDFSRRERAAIHNAYDEYLFSRLSGK